MPTCSRQYNRQEIHRDLQPDAGSPFGHIYTTTRILRPGDFAAPLLLPTPSIPVGEMLA